jgi:tetratricopeptide (TPR) repeat protein
MFSETIWMARGPVAFISSFYTDADYAHRHSSPLWQLRRDVHSLSKDSLFAPLLKESPGREFAWVAEWSEPSLANKQPLEVVDRLIDVLGRSELYVCVLGGSRRGASDHGSPITIASQVSATSYFEIELYAAVMYGKPIHLFVLDGFSPGPRLQSLLNLLAPLFPNWSTFRSMPASEILDAIRQTIRRCAGKVSRAPPLRGRLIQGLHRMRGARGGPGHELDGVLFLDGQFESRQLPQKDLIQSLLADCDHVPEMHRKASRMWLAARELMSGSYLPTDVQADHRLKDFLPLWDKVLCHWSSAAAWSGWQRHIYAGTVAPLHSLVVVRSQLATSRRPDAALASAYYSIANLMPRGTSRVSCLRRAAGYIGQSINQTGQPDPGDLAIRGSISIRMRNPWRAVSDFKQMLHLCESHAASTEKVGDAMVHLGFAYLYCGRLFKARDYLQRGVDALAANPESPNLARAKRKLAKACRMTGQFAKAQKLLWEANSLATRLGAWDQVNR